MDELEGDELVAALLEASDDLTGESCKEESCISLQPRFAVGDS